MAAESGSMAAMQWQQRQQLLAWRMKASKIMAYINGGKYQRMKKISESIGVS